MLSDIEIASAAKMLPIKEIAKSLDICEDDIDLYGKYKCKLNQSLFDKTENAKEGKLVLVTAINPTPAGEGKTTTSVGLGQAMGRLGKKSILALREPSLGPVFGIKGGAAGGGYAQVVPMEDINLHFTAERQAITAANNLLCAVIDNHIQQGNVLGIDPRRILFKRCMDMNDRVLRDVVVGMGGKANGVVREDGFQITVASEIMAILCLAADLADLKARFAKILVGYTYDNRPVFAGDLQVEGAMAALMKDAINPNLVQTLENTPAIIHGGPFANIAHGCNSVRATKLAMKLADYTITEAGFGSDLGAEKFLDIKCRYAGIAPSCIVLVATIRALKYNGGVAKPELTVENLEALNKGIANLGVHIENMQKYGVPVVVAINHFATDSEAEIEAVKKYCADRGASCAFSDVFLEGGEGGIELAKAVIEACEKESNFELLYDTEASIADKIGTIAKEIYRAAGVEFSTKAAKAMKDIAGLGLDKLPICVAKTQYSLTDDPKSLGAPSGHTIHVSDIKVSAGAGFIVCYTGDIMTMPGLPKAPAALKIDIDAKGNISGLF